MSDISFCDTLVQEIESRIIGGYESLTNKKLYPADPIRIFLQGLAYVIAHQRVVINETGKQNLLKYAVGANLDAIGTMTGTLRIPESNATVNIKFTRVAGSGGAIFIRAKTRVTADSVIYFATIDDATLSAGSQEVIVKCVAMTAGIGGNKYEAGTINKIVDPVSYLAAAINETPPSGGADTESDDNYRERIYIAPERFSVAGPILAYVYHAKSSHADIEDVAVLSPEPGMVEIYPLLKFGVMPSQEILDVVVATVNDEKVRPLTDNVSVIAPVEVNYELSITYYLYRNSNITTEQITKTVDDYILWQKSKLGRDINPDVLKAALIGLGVKRVDIATPAFTVIKSYEVANTDNVIITFGGLEDE